MVVQQRSVPPGKANVEDEALILIRGGRTVIDHLIGRQIPPRGKAEPVMTPAAGQHGRRLVTWPKVARGRRQWLRSIVKVKRVERGIKITAGQAKLVGADGERGIRHTGIQALLVQPRAVRQVEPPCRGKRRAGDNVRYR